MRRGPDTKTITEAFRSLRNEYSAAKPSRFRKRLSGVSAMGSGADFHYSSEADYLRMMETARSYDRNDMVIGQAIKRLISNVLQQGFQLDPQTGDEGLNAELKARWKAWSEDPAQCDSSGRHTFHALSKLALRHQIIDGDICALPLKAGSLEFVEAHRLRTPRNTRKNVVHGILMTRQRRPREYWFTKDNIPPHQPLTRVADIRTYKAFSPEGHPQVFHLFDPKRISQTRGITALAPIMDTIGMHDDIQFAKLVQQQIVSCFAIFRQREFQVDPPAPVGATKTETLADNTTRTLEGISPGMEILGAPGETLSGFSPNVPNAEFFDHAKLILTIISINLGLPLAVMLLDPSETNFSGWRGAIDQARLGFKDIQQSAITQLYRPTYHFKVRQWMAEDNALAGAAEHVFNHAWSPPFWPYIEPFKDAQADKLIFSSLLNSRREVLNRRGLDIDDVDRAVVTDNVRLIRSCAEAAQQLKKDFPDARIDWRDVLNLSAVDPPVATQPDQGDQGNVT